MRQRLLLFLLFCPLGVFAAKDSTTIFQGYSGGMMVHAGYLFGDNPNAPQTADGQLCSPQGATMGISAARTTPRVRNIISSTVIGNV